MTVSVRPADEASWDDLQLVFGTRGDPANCQCQWFKARDVWAIPKPERVDRLRSQTHGSGTTSGLLAYLDGEPAGWCAVEPRTAYERLLRARVPWAGRKDEDKADPDVWAVTCFVTRAGYRRRGVSAALARAAVDHARSHGARAVEGYPIRLEPGQTGGGELFVGTHSVFAAAGFTEVSRPTPRRVVMRLDL
ncbi:Acetyltransferase (GNAT) family protein [Asanoa hainanensis]|uniref:Acetyltransferase (GNAT) family protein n=1 Tax=Asanoa hainanensis TaxID=560556 RepID=A0A239PEW1_9ACTN|nr:GNAT family N-acetyltransferase [Asanoa hainanensis]SNT65617.1 Acetyltransferase (GNAT) family protein [Asanoa hainanensis]